jgi:tetratricopeptide (TPR) repeat protein
MTQQHDPPRSRPTERQTIKAKEHLKNAYDICVEGEELWFNNKKFNNDDYVNALRTLGYAAQDVVNARDLDPEAEIIVKDKTQGIITFTVDTMTARLLFVEGQMSIGTYLSEEEIRKGIETLKHHLVFRPYHAFAYALLAKAYTRVYERQNALDAIAKAIELDPNDIEIRKIRDDLANPIIGVPEPKGHPILNTLGWGLAPLLVPVGLILSIFVRRLEGLGVIVAIVGGVLWFIRNRRDNNEIYHKALGISPEQQKRTL